MDPVTIINLAMVALNGILQLVAEIRGQGSLTDDQILAQAQQVAAGNDAAYQAIVAALKITPPPLG